MRDVVSIKACSDNEYAIKINTKLSLSLGLDNRLKCPIGYGTQKCFVDIKVSDEVPEKEIILSQKVMDYLYLPDYPDFEIIMKDREIMIGPHVGIIISRKDEEITKARLKSALKFIPEYSKLHGSALVFALDKIDMSKCLIEGYCYNHQSQDFVRGVFPYPLSIYLRAALGIDLKNHFLSAIGNTVFNNFYLNKYEVYNWLSTDPGLAEHLPHTILYKSGDDILDMLKCYNKIYVKPKRGEKGIGVVKISLEDNRIAIRYREYMNNVEKYTDSSKEGIKLMESLFVPDEYIIQQPIDIMTFEGGVTDFRLMIQKDGSGSFVCKGIVAKIGVPGSIVSNVHSGGALVWGADLLKNALKLQGNEITKMEEKISLVGLKICNSLEKKGMRYGDLGIDIGMDRNRHLWLIEINSRSPDPRAALYVNDEALYKDIVSTPLLYAKFLAGFRMT